MFNCARGAIVRPRCVYGEGGAVGAPQGVGMSLPRLKTSEATVAGTGILGWTKNANLVTL